MSSNHQLIVLGEVLFDCFPDGKQIPGGAPFNVAWNLQALGQKPYLMSAVGDDSMGLALKQLAGDWGMTVDGIEILKSIPTSSVRVEFVKGSPRYTIVEHTAMDAISMSKMPEHPTSSILYHGSLAFREDESQQALMHFRERWRGRVFVDINIRNPWFDMNRFQKLISGVDYLKLNDEEYVQIRGEALNMEDPESQLSDLADELNLANLILTCGKEGALWLTEDRNMYRVNAVFKTNIADTVGAGDAFAAVCLLGILSQWDPQDTLKKASAFAGNICTLHGAITQDPSFYAIDTL